MKKRNLAIIPARGGSKRIPGKNIKHFLGKPIISYAIKAALESKSFEEVMVSTDDPGIAEVAKRYGANIPFMRTVKNSDDFATLADVAEEVLLSYAEKGEKFKNFCCILPTAALVSSKHIKMAFERMVRTKSDGVIPVVKYSYPIQRALKLKNDKLKMFSRKNYNIRSQDLPPAFHDSGQFYWLKTSSFLKSKRFFAKNMRIIEVPELEVQDIDTIEDWHLAEFKFKLMNGLIKF